MVITSNLEDDGKEHQDEQNNTNARKYEGINFKKEDDSDEISEVEVKTDLRTKIATAISRLNK